jgi:hypothetical protein
MKSKFTKQIVFLNPSVNLNKLAVFLENNGVNVALCKSPGGVKVSGNKVVCKDESRYDVFRFDIASIMLPDIYYKFSDNFLNRFFYRRFLKKNGIRSAIDYLIKNRFPLSEPKLIACDNNVELGGLLSEKNVVITSYLTSKDIEGVNFNKVVAVYKLSDNIDKFLGNDYAIVKSNVVNIEFFIKDQYIYLIADSIDIIEKVISKTFLKNVNMELVEKFKLLRNDTTMIKKIKKDLYLVNDYSFFNISLNPGKHWLETLGRYICAGKL